MSTTNLNTPLSPLSPSSINPLDRIPMTAYDRLRAEAAIRRGEHLAELMLEAINAMRSLFGSAKLKPRVLGPTA